MVLFQNKTFSYNSTIKLLSSTTIVRTQSSSMYSKESILFLLRSAQRFFVVSCTVYHLYFHPLWQGNLSAYLPPLVHHFFSPFLVSVCLL